MDDFGDLVAADTEGQVAEARAVALALATFWTTLTVEGLPDDLAAELTSQFASLSGGVWVVTED